MRRRGFTLLEMSISGGLLLLISGILLVMMIAAVNSLRLAERRAAVQRNALLLVGRLRQEVACAHPDSLQVEPTAGLTFISERTESGGLKFSSTGQRLWVRWLNVVRRPDQRVVLRQWSITNPSSPPWLTPPLAGAAGWSERGLAEHVQVLDFQVDANGALHLRLVTAVESLQYEVNTVLAAALAGG